ncbi:MAG: hypothetical protein V4477_16760 [Pseudomonadota bacterium]
MSRVVHGKRADGSFGLDVAMPGGDAYADDRNDATKFSFSSDWTDIVKYSQFGKVSVPVSGAAPTPYETIHTIVPIPNYGYVPHFEARQWDGANRVYDDWANFSDGFGVRVECFVSAISFQRFSNPYSVIYLVYRYPTDQQ